MTHKYTLDQSEKWVGEFTQLYARAIQQHKNRAKEFDQIFSKEDSTFLASIGASSQEIYDFLEDWSDAGEPDPDTVLRITAVRREYFLTEQSGQSSLQTMSMSKLPSMSASLAGFHWLPGIIEKAKAKLRGEMPKELMYGCGGDRPFLRSIHVDPADFLWVVWKAKDDSQQIIDYVTEHASGHSPQ